MYLYTPPPPKHKHMIPIYTSLPTHLGVAGAEGGLQLARQVVAVHLPGQLAQLCGGE